MIHFLSALIGLITWFWAGIDKWEKFAEILGILLGGVAAYYRFFKGRVYKGRLEVSVGMTEELRGSLSHIAITSSIKNIGASRIDIIRETTAVVLYSCGSDLSATEYISAPWVHQGTFLAFQDHEFLEAGESAQHQYLVIGPSNESESYKVDLEARAGRTPWYIAILARFNNEAAISYAGQSYWSSRCIFTRQQAERPVGHEIKMEWR